MALALGVGLALGGVTAVALPAVALACVCFRRRRSGAGSSSGKYNPSAAEAAERGARGPDGHLSIADVLKPPPEERLI